jgi:hypothetical protein
VGDFAVYVVGGQVAAVGCASPWTFDRDLAARDLFEVV